MAATQSATITVQEVIPPGPGKQKSKIVDASGDFYYAFPDKAANFVPGMTYDVNFTQSTFNGFKIRNIESGRRSQAAPQQAAAQQQPRTGAYGGGANDEHIFTSMMLKEAVRAQLLDPNNTDSVVELGRAMRAAHKAIWAPVQQQQAAPQQRQTAHPDMDDSIPF